MTLAYTSPFVPISLAVLTQALQDQGLLEDLAYNPSGTPGQIMLYSTHGASSWPYERTFGDDQVDFDIVDFLSGVAMPDQEIIAHENGESQCITIGTHASIARPASRRMRA